MRRYPYARGHALAMVFLTCLAAVALAGCALGPLGPASTPTPTATQITYHLDYALDRNCSWGTGRPATCQFRITNKATSNFTFTWQGTSSPAGATFSPPSGAVAPGQVSDVISATDPFICPLTFQFVDTAHGFKVESPFKDPCK
jgi:hypothetical protein